MTDQQQQQSTNRINHEGYIELQFEEVSRQAIDDLISHLLDVIDENTSEQPLRIFVNNEKLRQAQSITYLLGQLQAHKSHFVVSFPIRIAANFNMMLIASLLEIFIRSLPQNMIQLKAFSIDATDDAVKWLLEQ